MTGPVASLPVTLITPLSACRIRSKPPRAASGPTSPYPEIEPYLKRYVRGSHGIEFKERIKIMKLLWDAVGTEFGGRHELYEFNYAGNHEDIRIHAMLNVKGSGAYDRMIALAEQCMADYDEDGWTGDTWIDPDDIAHPQRS